MRIYSVILGSAMTGLALGALVNIKESNPTLGTTLGAVIFGSAIIAGVIETAKSK